MRHVSRSGSRAAPARTWQQPATWVLLVVFGVLAASLLVRAVRGPGTGRPVQVQVLNGSGAPELAQQAALELRRRGLDVVSIGNADTQHYPHTLVLLRRGWGGEAIRVRVTCHRCARELSVVREQRVAGIAAHPECGDRT